MALPAPAHAINWLFDANVGAFATYTDNVNQSQSDKEDSLVLRVSPGFTLRTEGSRRIDATIAYSLNGVARFGGGDDTDLYHNLTASGSAELVEDFFFIDASARVSQELISLLGSPADAAINDTNRATTGSWDISPYIRQRFGDFADFQARYSTGGALFENDVASDLYSNTFSASLVSGNRFSTLSWGLDYSYRDVSDRDSGDVDSSHSYEVANLSLGYALTRRFRLIGNVGHEWIKYDEPTAEDLDHSAWNAGFAWTPSRRTSIQATAGQRFFGDTYDVSASYRARASVWTVSYTENVNDISQATLIEGTTYVWNCNGSFVETVFPIEPEPGCFLVSSEAGLIPSLADGLYVAKTFRAGVNWGVRRITYSLNAFDIRRIYLEQNDAEDRTQGLNAGVSYRVDPLTSLYGNLALQWTEDPATLSGLTFDREDELLTCNLGVSRQFGPDLRGALTYRYYQRDSNDPAAEYTENQITASAYMSF